MNPGNVDISKLPDFGYRHHNLIWWGVLGFIAIEGSILVMLLASYLYGMAHSLQWPPTAAAPDLLIGTINTAILLLSGWPNHKYKAAAQVENLPGARFWLWVTVIFGLVFITVRIFEFINLNTRWDDHFYGSIIWAILGFHTLHILSDVIDSMVMAVFIRKGPVHRKRFDDLTSNAGYWYFVVLAWIPIYLTIYVIPFFRH
ncbi:MAG: heme-copper oxidase subunit III [Limisphaerales bacterium]